MTIAAEPATSGSPTLLAAETEPTVTRKARPAPGRFAVLRHTMALTRRNLRKATSSPGQILDVTLMPAVFALIFTYMFGGAISGNSASYREYLMPGIMGLTVTIATRSSGLGLNLDLRTGVMDRFRAMAVARSAVLSGRILADAVRLVASQVLVLAFGLAIGFRIHTGPLQAAAALGVLLLYGVALCWLHAFIGLSARSVETVQSIGMLAMVPLQFGSSIFVAQSTLPGWLRTFVADNPMTGVVDSARALLVGGPVAVPLLHALAWSLGLIAVFAPLSVWKYRSR